MRETLKGRQIPSMVMCSILLTSSADRLSSPLPDGDKFVDFDSEVAAELTEGR